ncbi:MAG: hypothetical protein C0601_06580 [Candidatus Muiribacterium halophilum]|uniref:Uncharacterized protein n=1 Tax=Muiribacterium halophilum TaxID=2053465 RepID=A0A2N5ZGB6_MUIH1|nr:MAG: hypothetical protein C0601_06580 [Candidatus Muirbacterium halophilum]
MENNLFDKIISNINIFFRKNIVFIGIIMVIFAMILFIYTAINAPKDKRDKILFQKPFDNPIDNPMELQEIDIDTKKFCKVNQQFYNTLIQIYYIENKKYPESFDQLMKAEDEKQLECIDGGEYIIGEDHKVYCTLHGELK